MNIKSIKDRISEISLSIQKEIVAEVLSVVPGTTFVTEIKAEARVDICESCEKLEITSRKCSSCGCFIDLKARVKKLAFINELETCPLNLW